MPKKLQYTKRHYVRISPEIDRKLSKYAKSLGMTIGATLRHIVENYLEHNEPKKETDK